MARLSSAIPGRSLAWGKGLAGLRADDPRYTVRRVALTAVAIGALISGMSATLMASGGFAESGVELDATGSYVLAVSPVGYGWQDGIRPGQMVEIIVASDEAGGPRIDTRDLVGHEFSALGTIADAGLRAVLPLGVAAAFFGCLAVLFLATRRRWVVPAAALALLAAGVPLERAGGAELSTAVLAGSALLPAVNLGRRVPIGFRLRTALVVAFVVLVAAWALARLAGWDGYRPLEEARNAIAIGGLIVLLVDRAMTPIWRGESIGMMRPRLFDAAFVAAVAGVGVLLADLGELALAGMLLVVIAVLPSVRRRVVAPIEHALLGDIRASAAAEAAETERAKLARELHDVPLQELAAVIRRLEIKPGTEAESEDLRNLASHLRNVAMELRPPVLDDLGLPAALDYLAEESSGPTMPVTAEIIDDTGFGASRRPPAEVELAMFRIASEAVGNAVRHSGGSEVRIQGAVAPGRVEVVVADDGSGLSTETARQAARRKRLGLASMRRRAQAIDAELWIDGAPSGTNVRVVWQA